jgi:uncharacterized protein (TIGR03790 family)
MIPLLSRTAARARRAALLPIVLWWTIAPISVAGAESSPASPRARPDLGAAELAVVVNSADPLSVATGSYYARKRHIPKENVITVRFDPQRDEMPAAEFSALKRSIDNRLSPRVQAYALTWVRPYRVACMSITSAFAFGADDRPCASGCRKTVANPYFDTATARPYDELHMRLAMSIAAVDFDHVKALIDRGAHADYLAPHGTAYLVTTGDAQRDVRASEYATADRVAEQLFDFAVVRGRAPRNRGDVMFYFTGATAVPGLASNRFLPGAVGDHLTSFGGMLTDSPQMSSLRWLEAGATGSYGTVVEPCNFPGKFPNVAVLLAHYLAGETLIEAYWKSVEMPGQGLFIGEPLAAPFRVR